MPLPKLRSIEAVPLDVEAKPLVMLRDPMRYAATPLLVPYPAFSLATTADRDRQLLAALEHGDSRAFLAALAADGDRTRVCGAAPLLVFLELLRGVSGRVLCHDQSRDERTRSAMTYASLAFPA